LIATQTEFCHFLEECDQIAKSKFLTNFVASVLLTEFLNPFNPFVSETHRLTLAMGEQIKKCNDISTFNTFVVNR
jgi:hypothetical protein